MKSKFNDETLIYMKNPNIYKPKKLGIRQRAAQFAPFAALSEFDDEVEEKNRKTDDRILLDSNIKDIINYKLQEIIYSIGDSPFVKIKYFVEDKLKTGGKYKFYEGRIKKIDKIYRKIIFLSGKIIFIDDILDIDY